MKTEQCGFCYPSQHAVYRLFIEDMGLAGSNTPDGIKWDGAKLDYRRLNEMMRELAGD